MKKILAVLSFAALLLSLSFFVFTLISNFSAANAEQVSEGLSNEAAAISELENVLAELEAELAFLIAESNLASENPQLITEEDAVAIAESFLNITGTANVMLFEDERGLTYEVDITDGELRYIAYISAINGDVFAIDRPGNPTD